MKSILKKTFLVLSIIMIASCDVSSDDNTSNNCSKIVGVGTISVTGPDTATANEEITLEVDFAVNNSCGEFLKFVQSQQSGNELIVTVNAVYTGCSCIDLEEVKTAPFKFKALSAGVYKLKFRKTNTEFITHTVTVS